MRREEQLLADILAAAEATERSLRDRERDDFLADEDARDATLYRLVVIGEAATRLPAAFRDRYPDIPWRSITGFRNRAVHAYFAMDWAIVWDTAAHAIPVLRRQIAAAVSGDASPPDTPVSSEP